MALGTLTAIAGRQTDFFKDGSYLAKRIYEGSTGETIAVTAPIQFFDDFLGGAIPDQWSSATAAVAPNGVEGSSAMVTGGEGGRILMTSGNNGIMTDDLAMLMLDGTFTPSNLYDINFEVKVGRGSTVGRFGFGFTDADATTVHEPAELDDEDVMIPNVQDGCGFMVNGDGASANWHLWAASYGVPSVHVKSNTESVAATAGTQILRVRISRTGYLTGWLNGTIVFDHATMYGNNASVPVWQNEEVSVDPTVAYTPFIYVSTHQGVATARTLTVDYTKIWAGR